MKVEDDHAKSLAEALRERMGQLVLLGISTEACVPAKDSIQLQAMIRKIIQYESFAFADTVDHYRKAMAFTGFDEGYVSYMDGHVSYAAGYFNENPYPTESYIFKHEMSDSIRNVRYDSVKVLMNKGLGFINYTGHGIGTIKR